MVEGRTPEEIIGICKKVGCHDGNSCPKQLALALDECLGKIAAYQQKEASI